MKSLEASRVLRDTGIGAFGTSDAAAILNLTSSHASRLLERLSDAGQVVRLKRSVWAFPDRIESLQVPEQLTAPQPCYISLQSALFYHGLISQIPTVVYAVSTARTRRWTTPLATVSIHHLHSAFFFGFEAVGNGAFRMATPEKAFLDCLYLSSAKSRLFARLLELDLHEGFNLHNANQLLNQVPSAQLRETLRARLAAYL